MTQTRGMMIAAALLAALACKSSSGAKTSSTAGQAGGVPEGMPGQPGAQGGAQQGRLEGRVALVDAQNREIAVDSGQATQQVKVDPSADITVDGKKAAFSDLKQGQEVRVSLDQGSDGPAAKKIEVTHTKK
jgi:cold shock CspA family protein